MVPKAGRRLIEKPSLPPILVLAGGLGTRLGQLALNRPKAMVEILGDPFVAHQLRLLKSKGAQSVVICTGYLGEMIQSYAGNGSAFGLKVDYVNDGETLRGTGGAVKHALMKFPQITEFGLMYGDSYLDCNYQEVYQSFLASTKPALMTVFHNNDQGAASNVDFSDNLVTCYEKDAPVEIPDRVEYIDYGLSFLKSDVFDAMGEDAFDLALVWNCLIAKQQLAGYEVKRRFYEIGTPEGLTELEELMKLG